MFKQKAAKAAIVWAALMAAYPQVSSAETFKSEDFLKWSDENRSFYLRTSIGMAGFIAGQNDKRHAKCVEDWYFSDPKRAEEKLSSVMRQNPAYHPRGVIIAVLQKACGPFTYR